MKNDLFKKIQFFALALFVGFAVHNIPKIDNDSRLRLGLFFAATAFLFGLITQVESLRKKFYGLQGQWYQELVSEKSFQLNGRYSTVALAVVALAHLLSYAWVRS